MFSLFRPKPKPVPLEQQLQVLAGCGLPLNPEATLEDLHMFCSHEEHEAHPYRELIPTLGCSLERDSYAPLCHRAWMCDYERVEGPGAYAEVITRLHQMSEQSLPISAIADHVDVGARQAWVEFDLAGTRVHWDARVEDDWLDPKILLQFAILLRTRKTPFRLYSNHTDFGQSAFLACLTPDEFRRLQELASFKLRELERQG